MQVNNIPVYRWNNNNNKIGIFLVMDILFQPNGDNTNLDDYEITLLSAFFNNIDKIKYLQKDRDTLYGNDESCHINGSDCQTYWNVISVPMTQFEANIIKEIQHIQISSIPVLSYQDILKT
ncbi:hypothetical protein CHS0354_030674 [Potamilus streckersoni]|uniref:Uncharacterized protein n=1 Tax=Potamilus streckersoni TaxID=2493646 RepID=A0AAE0SUI0_9BIVA|nr:hypothetical protein CHS0354_030674 [Potamilus streckersoni]